VNDFDSWDVCDQVCGNLFDKTPFAYHKATEWPHREQEFVRRAGFVLMAELAVHDKRASDEAFLPFFPLIKQYAVDDHHVAALFKEADYHIDHVRRRLADHPYP
jgi:3-methyladenine DNA glycosylase AlkD